MTNDTTGDYAVIADFDTVNGTITVVATSSTWTAGQTISNRPRIEGGVINENLGAVTDISSIDYSQPLYLEIVFNGETMRPRKLLPYVSNAMSAEKVGNLDASVIPSKIANETITGAWTFASTTSQTLLTLAQDGTGRLFDATKGTSTYFTILNDGKIGVGTSAPIYTLDVNGNGRFTAGLKVGAYSFPVADGNAGYVLKTNGAGVLSWAVDATGAGGAGAWDIAPDLAFNLSGGYRADRNHRHKRHLRPRLHLRSLRQFSLRQHNRG